MWGQIIGGLISGAATRKASKNNLSAQREAADLAYKRSMPWSTSGMFGGVTFDEEGKTVDIGLAPELQKEYDIALAGAEKQRQYISDIEADPMASGKKFYEMQKAIYAPEQEAERLAMENRLLGQGMLGSSGGAGQMGGLLQAQAVRDLEAQYQGLAQAQSMIDTYRGRASQDLSTAGTIGQLPLSYADVGLGTGKVLSGGATKGGEMISGAGKTGAKALSAWGSGFGTSIADAWKKAPTSTGGAPSSPRLNNPYK